MLEKGQIISLSLGLCLPLITRNKDPKVTEPHQGTDGMDPEKTLVDSGLYGPIAVTPPLMYVTSVNTSWLVITQRS